MRVSPANKPDCICFHLKGITNYPFDNYSCRQRRPRPLWWALSVVIWPGNIRPTPDLEDRGWYRTRMLFLFSLSEKV